MPDPLAAQRAVAMENAFEDLLVEREVRTVDAMVNAFRSNKATHERLIAAVAVVSELRSIRDELHRGAQKAIQQTEEEHARSDR